MLIFFTLFFTFVDLILSDCPLVPYPRNVTIGFINAIYDINPALHNQPQFYDYSLSKPFQENGISVAIGIAGLQLNLHENMNFFVEYIPTTNFNKLKFRIKINDTNYGWRFIKFNFVASQSQFIQSNTENVVQFSTGPKQGVYSIYKPIPNFLKFQYQPVINIFISGINLQTKPLNEEYYKMLEHYQNFKMFSTNKNLLQYFEQAIQIKRAINLVIVKQAILGRLFTLTINTNSKLNAFQFSYIMFSNSDFRVKHNSVTGVFSLMRDQNFTFLNLNNMEMLIAGMIGFNIPRNKNFNFELAFQSYFGYGQFSKMTNIDYFQTRHNFVAFQMKHEFVCSDCKDSSIIYQNKFCVSQCPRSYSQVSRLNNTYCDQCQIQRLKIVDPQTNKCVCAKRHFMQAKQDICKPCRYDCLSCSQATTCLTCDNEMMQTKRSLNADKKCSCPSIGYYDDSAAENILCQECDIGCLACYGPYSHNCLTCSQGKQLDSQGHCICQNGYQANQNGDCMCFPPKLLHNNMCIATAVNCSENQVEQFVQLTKRCTCKKGYTEVLDECIKCDENSIFDEQLLKCRCTNQTIFVNGKCESCPIDKLYDELTQTCRCDGSTFQTDQGTCIKCPTKMAYYQGKCQCIFNYYENAQGHCQRCLAETDGPKCQKSKY